MMSSIGRATRQAKRQADRAAWAAYRQANQARHDHVHVDRCEACWTGLNAELSGCETWDRLSVEVVRTLDAWLALA
jgi:hypothetical protein